MPAPLVLAGIPWLAGILGGVFSSLFGYFVQFATKRIAIVGAAVVVIVALTAGLFTALEALVAGLSLVVPPELSAATGLLLPANITSCAAIIATAHLLRFAYEWNIRIIQYKLF
jgi:hypothetical protein